MRKMQMRVIDKKGIALGVVSVLSAYRNEVSYVKLDKWGCPDGDVHIAKYPAKVDIQVSIGGGKWETVTYDNEQNDDELISFTKTMRGA